MKKVKKCFIYVIQEVFAHENADEYKELYQRVQLS